MSTFLPPKRYSKYLPTPQKLLKVPSETWDWNLSSYMVPLTVHYISNCRSEAPSATSYTLGPKIYPSPCTLKPNFKAPPPLCRCPSTSCSFSPFASFASFVHSDSSPCYRSTPPHRRQYHLLPSVSCCPSPEPTAIMCLCLCRSKRICSCCVTACSCMSRCVRVCAHECVRVCMCACSVYLSLCVCLCVLVRVLVYACVRTCMYVCAFVCTWVYVFVRLYNCVRVRVFSCVYVCI